MSKMASIQARLNSRIEAPAPVTLPKVTPATAASAKPPSREGKTHIGAYLPPGFKSSLRLVQAQTGEDTQTLIARALNELFRGHNVPVIDHN